MIKARLSSHRGLDISYFGGTATLAFVILAKIGNNFGGSREGSIEPPKSKQLMSKTCKNIK